MTTMTEPSQPGVRDPRHPFVASPFTRLARTHAFSVGGDALFAVGLAGSVFFSVDPAEARWKIGLYLLLTFAPFAVAAPFIGPVLDRVSGGRRWMIAITLGIRAVLCVLIVRDLNSVAFYFEAFLMLVFSKTYLISRAAVVPTTVRSDRELVEANSKLALLSGMAAIVAGGPGLLLLKIGGDQHGPQLVVGVGAVVFAVGVGFATRLPRVTVAPEPVGQAEKQELRSAGIRLAASAMALLRCAVGLLVLMVAFAFKNGDLPAWTLFGAVVAAQAGVLAGAGLAPRLRLAFSEPRIIIGSLATTMIGGIVAAVLAGPGGAMLLCFLMGTTSGTAKQAFDALVQRDAPDANRGRSFARFETKFQLAWVLGAAMPLILPFPLIIGYAIIGGAMAVGMVSYWFGQRRVAKGTYDWESPSRKLVRRGLRKVDASLAPKIPGEAVDPAELRDAPSAVPAGVAIGTAHRGGEESDWVPPAGFVSRGLNDPTTVESAPLPPPPSDAGPAGRPELFDADTALGPQPLDAEAASAPDPPTSPLPPPPAQQPTLPLDFSDPDGDPTTLTEPRWRDSPK
jgi:hypothetical protein